MISYLMVISVFLTIVISMWLYIRVPSSNIEEVMKPIIKSDDKLLLKSKIAYYDYKEKPKNHIKNLIKYRERLIFRYQYYRKIKNNNIENPGITSDYIEYRMEEIFDFLQTLPPF